MTHVVPEGVEVPAQPVALVSSNNVKFVIKGTGVSFYETSEPINNQDTFETFDLARAGAIQAFAKHKSDVLTAIAQTEKDLVAAQAVSGNISNVEVVPVAEEPVVAVAQPVVQPVAQPVAPVSQTPVVRANSPAVQVTPIA